MLIKRRMVSSEWRMGTPSGPFAIRLSASRIAPCRASKCLKTLKTARASYWLKLAWIWDRRHFRSGSALSPWRIGSTPWPVRDMDKRERRDRELRITGSLIREFGYQPASWWKDAIGEAGGRDFADPAQAREYLDRFAPPPAMPLRASGALRWTANIEAEDEAERANIEAVSRHMDELMRVPTVVAGAIMPDACPSDHRLGAIPVGGVAATRDAIHPGMHSADICCSMAVTIFDSGSDAGRILDAGMKLSHFGAGGRAGGGRNPARPRAAGSFRAKHLPEAIGRRRDRAQRDPGRRQPLLLCRTRALERPGRPGDASWLTRSGREALCGRHGVSGKVPPPGVPRDARAQRLDSQRDARGRELLGRAATDPRLDEGQPFRDPRPVAATLGLRADDRFWNEHNFVFRRSDGLFYHAKGATPAYADFASDTMG